ncbi:MAG: hypothetical protein ACXVC0_07455 [Bdellovibrionota bacterium]
MKALLLLAFAFSLNAQATELYFGFGASAAAPAGPFVGAIKQAKLDRREGGETVEINFWYPLRVSNIRLSVVSKSGNGAVLVREFRANMVGPNDNGYTSIPPLYLFENLGAGNPVNFQGFDLLANQHFVSFKQNLQIQNITLQLEGFRDDDSALLLQISSPQSVTNKEIDIARPPLNPPSDPDRGCINSPCSPGPGDEDGLLCNYPVPPEMQCNPDPFGRGRQ